MESNSMVTRQFRLYRVTALDNVKDKQVGPREVYTVLLNHWAKTTPVSALNVCCFSDDEGLGSVLSRMPPAISERGVVIVGSHAVNESFFVCFVF